MNKTKNIINAIGACVFGAMALNEVFIVKSGFTSDGFLISLIMFVLMLAVASLFSTKFHEDNHEVIAVANENLKKLHLPASFLGSLTLPCSLILLLCSFIQAVSGIITLPAVVGSLVNILTYLMVGLLPAMFFVGVLGGHAGKGVDFMLYSLALIIYIAYRYFVLSAINPYVCGQLIFALFAWDVLSGITRTSAPPPKEKKEKVKKEKAKKEKKSKKSAKTEEAEVSTEAETADISASSTE